MGSGYSDWYLQSLPVCFFFFQKLLPWSQLPPSLSLEFGVQGQGSRDPHSEWAFSHSAYQVSPSRTSVDVIVLTKELEAFSLCL